MNKPKIFIAGCSFSEPMAHTPNYKWVSWTDLLLKDYQEKYNIVNISQSSFGQGMIAQRTLEMLSEQHINFDVDFAIIQWSGIGRGYAVNEDEFIKRIFKQNEMSFAPHIMEYLTLNTLEKHACTTAATMVSNSLYKSSLTHMVYVKKLLECHKIPYVMFWGWEQLNEQIQKDHYNLLKILYDDTFIRFGEHGGMSEYIVQKIGEERGILKNDFHPTSEGQRLFYNDIIKPIIEKLSI